MSVQCPDLLYLLQAGPSLVKADSLQPLCAALMHTCRTHGATYRSAVALWYDDFVCSSLQTVAALLNTHAKAAAGLTLDLQ